MKNLTEVQAMNTYKRNLETQKIELNFEKSTYVALSDDVTSEPFKKRIGKYGVKINDYANAWLWDRERIGWSDGR